MADKIPRQSLCARHLSAQRSPWCTRVRSHSFVLWGCLALISAQIPPFLLLLRLPGPAPALARSSDISELSKPTPSCESYCLCCFLQCNLLFLCAPMGHVNVPLPRGCSTCWSGHTVPLSLAMVSLHSGKGKLPHCGHTLLFSNLQVAQSFHKL